VQVTAPGPAAPIRLPGLRGETILEALTLNARDHGDLPAMRRRGESGWDVLTWADYEQRVSLVGAGLAELGVRPGQTVAIVSANCAEWHLADLGAIANGSITVPVYPTSSPSQIAYILGHADSRVCFVDTHEQLGKVLGMRAELPHLEHLVLCGPSRRAGDTVVIQFGELLEIGEARLARHPNWLEESRGAISRDQLATIVYTSGTTGTPKGALITHANIMWTLSHATGPFGINEGERLLSFLPLSHVAERMMSLFLPIAITGETWFARSLATVVEDLPACRPTVFLAVPRVWEKLRDGIEDHIRSLPLAARAAVNRYVALGLRKVEGEQGEAMPSQASRLEYLALDRTLGRTIRERLGLDQAHVLVSSAAPIHPSLVRWFHAIGLPILEVYGQTETCGPATANRPAHARIGTVGSALPGVSARLGDDQEILIKGGNVCAGYFKDEQATKRLLDEDGWMHSGDTGTLDAEGCLRITGRTKDLIITAGGQNVAPQGIETDLCSHHLISQAVVVGDGRRYLAALITLDPENLGRWAQERGKLVELEALANDPDLVDEIQHAVDDVNHRWSHAEGIRKFRILAHDLTVADGELTPTLKVRRTVVCDTYADAIDEIYSGA
jgi:long-chain acyl-CoA synthetase